MSKSVRTNKLFVVLFVIVAMVISMFPPIGSLPKADAATIKVDGNISDWSGVNALRTNTGTAQSLKVTSDDKNLYLLVEGAGLSTATGHFWLDTDNNSATGYLTSGWGTNGVEWMIENNTLYSYAGDGTSWNWNEIAKLTPEQFFRSASVVETVIPLATLKIGEGNKIKVGYIDNNSATNRLPAADGTLPEYVLAAGAKAPGAAKTVTSNPVELDKPLNNPFKGWAPSAKTTSYPQPVKLVYAGVTWKELEPTKGKMDFAAIEAKNNFANWKSKGVKVVFRLILDSPTGEAHRDIPDWLYDEMVAAGENPGTVYNDPTGRMGAGNNMGFSPNYSAPSVIAGHKRVVEAIANRYNTNARPVAFVQIGSLGHWGEFHTWPYTKTTESSENVNFTGVFPPLNVSNQYVQHYIDAFAGKEDKIQVLIRRSVALATDNNKGMKLGMFNDVFGDKPSFDADWGWYTGTQNGYWDDLGQKQPGNPNFWESRISAGEFYSGDFGMRASLTSGAGFDETMRETEMSKVSWLGPNSPASLAVGNELQANIDKLKKRMGYHFVLKEVTHPSAITGSSFEVKLTVENKGVQHFPFNWPLEIQLRKGDTVVAKKRTNVDLRTWKTGTYTITDSIPVSALAAGKYDVSVAIINPETSRAGIDFANEGRFSIGSYKLGTVTK
ncbi:protein of unknown function [Paenibacillaceae bacterium GAS479]|nr:protein of unknown function [Paenibacillaceae bacterium GAS479]